MCSRHTRTVVIVWAAGAAACADNASADPKIIPIEVDARAESSAACVRGVDVAFGDGCRSTWLCAEAGVVALTCGVTDAGIQCVCTADEDSRAPFFPDAAACLEGGASASVARTVCGWSIP